MKIFAIGDLHLSSSGEKPMDIFGPQWRNHGDKIAGNWKGSVGASDFVLVPGDLSWAMRIEEAKADIAWLDALPGSKILIKGNHDYWWPSIGRLRALLKGSSITVLQYDSVRFGPVVVGGVRLWDIPGVDIPGSTMLEKKPAAGKKEIYACHDSEETVHDEKIFLRELGRLRLSLESMDEDPAVRLVMTHFPPTNEHGLDTPVTKILEHYRIDLCVFGHLHDLKVPRGKTIDFVKNGIRYILVSCDAVGFSPYQLLEV
jgi:predicted phosphohydrolase